MAPEQTRPVTGSGLGPAYAAVRVRLGLVIALFALAAVGWWWTVGQMQGMDEGPWTSLGAFGWFLGVWVVMMAAMMFPSVAPTVALYSRLTRSRSPLSPTLFTAGYLLTWTGAGLAVVGTASTLYFGLRTHSLHDDYVREPTEQRYDDGREARLATNLSIGVAAVGAVMLAVDLLLLAPRARTPGATAARSRDLRFEW